MLHECLTLKFIKKTRTMRERIIIFFFTFFIFLGEGKGVGGQRNTSETEYYLIKKNGTLLEQEINQHQAESLDCFYI